MRSGKDAFLTREWLAGDADVRLFGDPSLADGVSCDDSGCVTQAAGGALVALALRPDALADDCTRAALIVTSRQAPSGCGASVISTERLRRQGALALRRTRDGFAVDAVKPGGIDRPGAPGSGEGGGGNNIPPPRGASPPPGHATPSEADLPAHDR